MYECIYVEYRVQTKNRKLVINFVFMIAENVITNIFTYFSKITKPYLFNYNIIYNKYYYYNR